MVIAERAPILDIKRHLILDPKSHHGHIPTYAGLNHSQEWIDRMKLVLKGRIKSPREIESRSHIWNIVRKIVTRDRTIPYREIADIASFTLEQIENTIHNKSLKSLHQIPPFTPQEKNERRKRANANVPSSQRPPISQNEIENRKFAGLLLENSFITDDLTVWDNLNEAYENNNIPLPKSFSRKLILEAFITAVTQAEDGNKKMLNLFKKIMKSMDANWSSSLTPDLKLIRRSIIDSSEIDLELWNIAQAGDLLPEMVKEGFISEEDVKCLRRFFKGEEEKQPEGPLNRLSIGVARLS